MSRKTSKSPLTFASSTLSLSAQSTDYSSKKLEAMDSSLFLYLEDTFLYLITVTSQSGKAIQDSGQAYFTCLVAISNIFRNLSINLGIPSGWKKIETLNLEVAMLSLFFSIPE